MCSTTSPSASSPRRISAAVAPHLLERLANGRQRGVCDTCELDIVKTHD
jgi:hypothetical protein